MTPLTPANLAAIERRAAAAEDALTTAREERDAARSALDELVAAGVGDDQHGPLGDHCLGVAARCDPRAREGAMDPHRLAHQIGFGSARSATASSSARITTSGDNTATNR